MFIGLKHKLLASFIIIINISFYFYTKRTMSDRPTCVTLYPDFVFLP